MIKQKSCGAVVFIKNKEIKYLILQYGLGHWDFPRGLIEENETEKEAALREIKEEAELNNTTFISGFKEKLNIFFREKGELIVKEIIYFLVRSNNDKVKLSYEHLNFSWLNYEDALEKLTFKKSKEILKKANNYLNSSLLNY